MFADVPPPVPALVRYVENQNLRAPGPFIAEVRKTTRVRGWPHIATPKEVADIKYTIGFYHIYNTGKSGYLDKCTYPRNSVTPFKCRVNQIELAHPNNKVVGRYPVVVTIRSNGAYSFNRSPW